MSKIQETIPTSNVSDLGHHEWATMEDYNDVIAGLAEVLAVFKGDAMLTRDGCLMAAFWLPAGRSWRVITTNRKITEGENR